MLPTLYRKAVRSTGWIDTPLNFDIELRAASVARVLRTPIVKDKDAMDGAII